VHKRKTKDDFTSRILKFGKFANLIMFPAAVVPRQGTAMPIAAMGWLVANAGQTLAVNGGSLFS
jgi:hypothetical protein